MSLPRMSWHIGDYKKDTGHLRAAEHGAYFLLCMHYWATGGLPDNDRQLATIACMTDREWKAARPLIEPLFKGDGKWRHKRIDKEIASAQTKYEKLAAAGSQGGKAAALARKKPSDATATLEPRHSDATQSLPANAYQPITDNQEEDGGDSRARAPGIKTSDEATAIATELLAAKSLDLGAMEAIGLLHMAQSWVNEGLPPWFVLSHGLQVVGSKRKFPHLNYLDKAIRNGWAERQSEPQTPTENTHEGHRQHHGSARRGEGRSLAAIAVSRARASGAA